MKKFSEKNINDSYKYNPNSEKARKAIDTTFKRFSTMIKNYVLVFEDDSPDLIYLFPLNDINKVGKELKQIVIGELRKAWTNAGFNIKEEKPQLNDTYRIGFMALMYRLEIK